MKYVENAVEQVEKGNIKESDKNGILYKLLQVNKKVAIVMASDMIFAGVDTSCR